MTQPATPSASTTANPQSAGGKSPRPLYQHQGELPHLPVPSLDETGRKYIQTIQPFLSQPEFAKSRQVVEQFIASPEGQVLQKRLLARAQQPGMPNWLADWWNDIAYLRVRDPVVIFVSYFYAFVDDVARSRPAQRAADIAFAAQMFREQVVNETLSPEAIRKQPLCMASYKNMFNTCRIPAPNVDYLRNYSPSHNEHIAVVRRNQFYTIPTLHTNADGSRRPLTLAEWETQFQRIIDQSKPTPSAGTTPALGVLTSQNRDSWATHRASLLAADVRNVTLLEQLEGSAYLICLDDTTPSTRDAHSRTCWHGDGRNRFYDKSLQFIVNDNGKAGFLGEHAGMDGTATSRLCNYILDHAPQNYQQATSSPSVSTAGTSLAQPNRLDFHFDATVRQAIDQAGRDFDRMIDNHQLRVLAYQGYGKNLIKAFRASPDSYVQMLMQLAYYKMYGVCNATYESVQTRKFAQGRTEVCRSVSNESVAWVHAMASSSTPAAQRLELARVAINAHSAYMKEAAEGRGVDRHLFGLRMCLKPGEERPALFQDPVFAKSCHWNLSTSQLSSKHFDGWGYGEVVPDGFGLAYMIKDDSLHFNITCPTDGLGQGAATKLCGCLEEAAEEMRGLFQSGAKAQL
ncbi:acyltransferase ChoActase/COT/CPT [Dimargaris cristalligena]|uniref:Carnitine O-acetyltransferase, mitochondrial n=1 Tax=Dimargaris cristalligena TaxID=215637 RepID=A0A4P9ZPV8_9FUNG|nr:acyltransferase ChoActase/COT/CPT [Dimargaris cristalligena]|eukprot:RKP35238.1 acyltransferase ChoActase/COT/CPT [Dimargaris cristalligena]